jgi:hypothetical protein
MPVALVVAGFSPFFSQLCLARYALPLRAGGTMTAA